ncbi:type II toxin-antitoxin system VapC family toxin [Granulicella sibirica]|uniref:PIN domain-containing protein n=1 Tax=Granulicella sibirica TaxID=2479048 RepID=A0A4Q0T4E3_9BACT|nr:type II toxin-antitoxin system VapC family toxin [Granulicella sibirica]RXH57420.1 hypothetical protein GRAN_0730 [Granulicella sibirica]
MKTALDTNILSALLSREPGASEISHQLGRAKQEGAILISPVVYAELLAHPRASESFIDQFVERTGIEVDFRFGDSVWREAGQRFARHAARRRRATISGPRRLLADFLVGAHALSHADRLMTLDTSIFALDFPDLLLYPVIAPANGT